MKKILSPEEYEEKRIDKILKKLEKDNKVKPVNEDWKTKYSFAHERLKERLADRNNKLLFEVRAENENSEYNSWRIQAFWYKQGYKAAFEEESKRLENIRNLVINAASLNNERYYAFLKSIRSFNSGIAQSIQDYNCFYNKNVSIDEIKRQVEQATSLNCKTYKEGDKELETIKQEYVKQKKIKK